MNALHMLERIFILRHRLMKLYLQSFGGLAQLARALAWHARGRRFDPDTLHNKSLLAKWAFMLLGRVFQ